MPPLTGHFVLQWLSTLSFLSESPQVLQVNVTTAGNQPGQGEAVASSLWCQQGVAGAASPAAQQEPSRVCSTSGLKTGKAEHSSSISGGNGQCRLLSLARSARARTTAGSSPTITCSSFGVFNYIIGNNHILKKSVSTRTTEVTILRVVPGGCGPRQSP